MKTDTENDDAAPTLVTRKIGASGKPEPSPAPPSPTPKPKGASLASASTPTMGPAPAVNVKKGMGLGTKFFLAAAALLLVTMGAAVAITSWRANQVAERKITDDLRQVPAIFATYKATLDSQLKSTMRALADDTGSREVFSALPDVQTEEGRMSYASLAQTEDGKNRLKTVWDYAKTKADVLKAKTVLLFDPAGALIVRSDKEPGDDYLRPFVYQGEKAASSVRWVADAVEKWQGSTATIREGKTLSIVSSAPIFAGEKAEAKLVGIIAAFFPLDAERARTLKGITGGQVGFLVNTAKRGEAPKAELSAATDGLGGDAFVTAFTSAPGTIQGVFVEGKEVGPIDLDLQGDRRIIAGVPIKKSGGDETLGAFTVSRSRDEETAAFREIRNTLLLIGILSLLVAIPMSLAMGRRIARPLEELANGAMTIREGDLDVKLPEGGGDEVGALARAFSSMVAELKEKRQLEELLAEMQRRPDEITRSGVTEKLPSAIESQFPTPGHLFANRYEIVAQIGKGGMGQVFRAIDRELDDEVALKVLMETEFEEGTQAVATLKQEIRLARKITHQNVARTHDLGEAGGIRFLTMEYIPGTTLREVVDRKGSIALAPGLQIAKQLCRGLAAVHEAGIIHRDIKPHNIMVLPNGVVKLMDFGIAKTTEGIDPSTSGDQTVGTPYYMSPEQAQGKSLDARSDLYSVGVVLFELFTGQRPFEGKDALDVMKKHVTAEPPRARQLRADIPDLVDRILLACLAKTPEKRPPSANDLYGALMRVAV